MPFFFKGSTVNNHLGPPPFSGIKETSNSISLFLMYCHLSMAFVFVDCVNRFPHILYIHRNKTERELSQGAADIACNCLSPPVFIIGFSGQEEQCSATQ